LTGGSGPQNGRSETEIPHDPEGANKIGDP